MTNLLETNQTGSYPFNGQQLYPNIRNNNSGKPISLIDSDIQTLAVQSPQIGNEKAEVLEKLCRACEAQERKLQESAEEFKKLRVAAGNELGHFGNVQPLHRPLADGTVKVINVAGEFMK